MQQPVNFDSAILDGLLADWLLALREESVEVIGILGPDVFSARSECLQVRAVHPPRMLDLMQALADRPVSEQQGSVMDLPMASWQDISRGPYNQLARWQVLAISHGLQSMVRVAIPLPRGRAFECCALTSRALRGKEEATSLVWSVLNMWPKIKPVIADLSCPLSARERECLALAFDGLTAGETAAALQCGERTVNYHIANAMRKLRAENKLAAVERACWFGVI